MPSKTELNPVDSFLKDSIDNARLSVEKQIKDETSKQNSYSTPTKDWTNVLNVIELCSKLLNDKS